MPVDRTDDAAERTEARGCAVVGLDARCRAVVLNRIALVVDVHAGGAMETGGEVERQPGSSAPRLRDRSAERLRMPRQLPNGWCLRVADRFAVDAPLTRCAFRDGGAEQPQKGHARRLHHHSNRRIKTHRVRCRAATRTRLRNSVTVPVRTNNRSTDINL
jgi:hypothetical protein